MVGKILPRCKLMFIGSLGNLRRIPTCRLTRRKLLDLRKTSRRSQSLPSCHPGIPKPRFRLGVAAAVEAEIARRNHTQKKAAVCLAALCAADARLEDPRATRAMAASPHGIRGLTGNTKN